MISSTQFKVFADFGQFYLFDDEVQPAYPEFVDDSHIADRFQLISSLIAIYTTESREVDVVVSVFAEEPVLNPADWQHVVRCSLVVPSGRLVLAGCTDYLADCPRIQVPIGHCGVMLLGRNLDQSTGEAYDLYLWPSDAFEASIVKRHSAMP